MPNKLAESVAVLLNYAEKWRLLYYVFFVLLLDMELSILFDKNLIFQSTDADSATSNGTNKQKILSEKSILTRYIGMTSLAGYISSSTLAYPLIVFLLFSGLIVVSVLYFHFPSKNSLINKKSGVLILSILLTIDYWLELSLSLFLKVTTCKLYTKLELVKPSGDQSQYMYTPAYWVSNETGTKVTEKYLSDLTQDVQCWTVPHIILVILAGITVILVCTLKWASDRLVSHRMTSLNLNRRSKVEYLHLGSVVAIALARSLPWWISGVGINPDLYFTGTLILLLLLTSIHLITRAYFSREANLWRSIQQTCLFYFCCVVIFERKHITANSATSTLICELFLLSLLIKITMWLRSLDISRSHANKPEQRLERVEELVYSSIEYLENITRSTDPTAVKSKYTGEMFRFYLVTRRGLKNEWRELEDTVASMLENYKRKGRYLKDRVLYTDDTEDSLLTESSQDQFKAGEKFYPPHSTLLDSIAETPEREVKCIIKLLTLLLDIVQFSYGGVFSKMPIYLQTTMMYFHINYQGRMAYALYLLRSGQNLHITNDQKKTDFHWEVLKATIQERVRESCRSGNIVLTDIRPQLMFTNNQTNSVDISRAITFLRTGEMIKKHLREVIGLKQVVASSAQTDGFELKTLYDMSARLTGLMKQTADLFSSIERMVGENTVYVQLLRSFYYIHLMYELKKGTLLLSSLVTKKFRYGLQELLGQGAHSKNWTLKTSIDQEVVMVVSPEEEKFHKILFSTSNVAEHLNYKVAELVDQDLSILLPLPVRDVHKALVNPKTLSGVLLESKEGFELQILNKDKYLIPMELTVRLGSLLGDGTQYIAKMDFLRRSQEYATVVISPKLELLETCKLASSTFQKGSILGEYSEELQYLASQYISANSQIKETINSSINESAWSTYKKLQENSTLTVLDREGNKKDIDVHFTDIYIRNMKSSIFYMRFKAKSSAVTRHEEDLKEIGLRLTKFVDISQTIEVERPTWNNFGNDCDVEIKMISLKKGSPEYSILNKRQLSPINRPRTLESLRKSNSGRYFGSTDSILTSGEKFLVHKSMLPGLYNLRNIVISRKRSVFEEMFQRTSLKLRDDEHASLRGSAKKNSYLQTRYEGSIKTMGSIAVQETLRDRQSSEKIAAFIRKGYFARSLKKYLIILLVILCLVFVANLMLATSYIDQNKQAYLEIKDKTKYMDTSTWALYSVTTQITVLDLSRMVYDGVIPRDHFNEYAIPDALDMLSENKGALSNSMLLYNGIMELEMRNFTISAAKTNSFFSTLQEIDLRLPEQVIDQSSLLTIRSSVNTALQRFQPYIEEYLTLNSTNLQQANQFTTLEGVLRYNLYNGLLKYTMDVVEQFNDYVVNVASLSEQRFLTILYMDMFIACQVILLTTLVFLILKHRACSILRRLVNFRVSDLRIEESVFNKLRISCERFFMDEFHYFGHVDKLFEGHRTSSENEFAKGLTKKSKSNGGKKTNSSRDRDSQRVSVSKKLVTFGLPMKLVLVSAVVIVWGVIRYLRLNGYYQDSIILKNSIDLYSVTCKIWSYAMTQQVSLTNLLLWDKSVPVVEADPTFYLEKSSRQLDVLISQLVDMKKANLGNFTQPYRVALEDGNVCEVALKRKPKDYHECLSGQPSYLDANIATSLKRTQMLTDQLYSEWKLTGSSLEASRKILLNPEFKSLYYYVCILGLKSVGALGVIYYKLLSPLAPQISTLVENPPSSLSYLSFNLPITLLLLSALLLIFKHIFRLPDVIHNITYLFSIELHQKNPWMTSLTRK